MSRTPRLRRLAAPLLAAAGAAAVVVVPGAGSAAAAPAPDLHVSCTVTGTSTTGAAATTSATTSLVPNRRFSAVGYGTPVPDPGFSTLQSTSFQPANDQSPMLEVGQRGTLVQSDVVVAPGVRLDERSFGDGTVQPSLRITVSLSEDSAAAQTRLVAADRDNRNRLRREFFDVIRSFEPRLMYTVGYSSLAQGPVSQPVLVPEIVGGRAAAFPATLTCRR